MTGREDGQAASDRDVTYVPTARDFALGNEIVQRARVPVSSLVITSVVFGVLIALFLPGQGVDRIEMTLRMICMSLGVFVGLLAIMKVNRLRARKNSVRNHDLSPFAHQPLTVTWNDDGLSITSPNGYQRYPWKDFIGWGDHADVLVLFFGPHLYIALPKREFTAGERNDITAHLERMDLKAARLFPI